MCHTYHQRYILPIFLLPVNICNVKTKQKRKRNLEYSKDFEYYSFKVLCFFCNNSKTVIVKGIQYILTLPDTILIPVFPTHSKKKKSENYQNLKWYIS